jgi:hypothetical protein
MNAQALGEQRATWPYHHPIGYNGEAVALLNEAS